MEKVHWPCPACHAGLTCAPEQLGSLCRCPGCSSVSCPRDVLTGLVVAQIGAIETLSDRELRQQLRDVRICLQDAYEDELKQLLGALSVFEISTAGTAAAAIAHQLCDVVEDELEARVRETGWDKSKRLARRGAKATKDWLKTEDGKAAVGVAGFIAACFGFNLLG